jgi:hypothetical protein
MGMDGARWSAADLLLLLVVADGRGGFANGPDRAVLTSSLFF